MSVVKRLGRAISGNVSALLDKLEDPSKLADLALEDMDKAIRQGKRAMTELRGEAKRHEQKAKLLQEEADQWYRKAAVALQSGEEALARDALHRRHELLTQAVAETQAAREANEEVEQIIRQMARLQVERDAFAARKGTLVTQAQLRKGGTDKPLSTRLGGDGKGPTAVERFEELERRFDTVEAERELDELLGIGKDAEIEGKFRQLEQRSGVDDELAALKARLDKAGKPG
jgi:phage shock protein A